ncbi:ribonuclease H-like domain-containing protein [Tanacetum coccineum]
MDGNILSSGNTTTASIFEPYLKTREKNNTKKDDERSQTKHKCNNAKLEANNASNTLNYEQPNKRMCNAERFEAIKYSLGSNEEYIDIRRCKYDTWERNEDTMPQIYQEIFQKRTTNGRTSLQRNQQNNVNSFKPTAQTTTNVDGTSTSMIPGVVTTEEKTQKKNDVKARSMLLMVLPNENLLTFNQYKDAKTLFDAIQIRFGGNDATKKTQKILLKQMYKNFNAPSTESLDSIINSLQKIVSQLAILGENISQEDLNLKFLRSLSSEWNTHVVVWRNKPDLDSMSFDDLYNNFKIVEQEVKRTTSSNSNSNSNSQNMAFVSSPSSTNDLKTANVQIKTVSSSVSTDSTQDSTANLSDARVYSFLANQPNGSQLVHEDLEQIHEDDLEEMDLKWQLALLSMRARRYYQRTGKKITINGSDTAGYDKSKVKCFNCHKMGHFARECRSPRSQESRPRNYDNGNRNQDSSRRTVNVEETSSKAMVAFDGAGFDWSFMAEEEVTANMALMAFSDSEVYNNKTCSNTCLKSFETLKTQLDNLRVEFNKSEFNLATYKRGLASVEEQLVFYKKNEVMFSDQIDVLKRDASFKDSEIIALKSEIDKLKKEKEINQIKIDKFENASKCLDKLIGSQIFNNSRKGVGYNAVPPPPTGLFAPPTIDFSYSGTSNEVKTTLATLLVEELVSEKEKQTAFPTKIEFVKQQDKTTRKLVKYADMYRSQKPKGNQRNWNNLKSQQLGSDFVMYNKACFVCGSFDHVQAHCKYHQREGIVYGNNYNKVNYNYTTNRTHPNAQRNMVPRVVLMKTGLKSFNIDRTVNTAHTKSTVYSAKPMSHFSKSAQSTVKRPYQSKTVLTNKKFSQKVNTAKVKVNTVRPKAVNTPRPNSAVVNTVRANQENDVKALACWVNPPTDDQGYVDSGCSRNMTGNISYLSDFQEFDGGYVTFGGGGGGGKITGKGTLKTGKLDFQDLPDESQILLKIPRKNNMYSVDMKNIVPKESLTCLVAKATLDESMLWHRRLGHVKFKTINKLVKDNLMRSLPSKRFENDQTCVACLKGKQHKALCIKREYRVARTPQQNGVAERRNKTLIEAARTIIGYGYCKNHKKTVKTGQTRTRERIECTRAGSF